MKDIANIGFSGFFPWIGLAEKIFIDPVDSVCLLFNEFVQIFIKQNVII